MAKKYVVAFRLPGHDHERKTVEAKNAYEAWKNVAYTHIDGEYPYSAWVEEVRYSTGRIHYFNSFEGNPLGE